MSAIVSCVVFAIRRRSFPTRRVSRTKSGISANANSASCQLSRNIAIIVAMTVVTFEAIEVAVEVTTFWTPPMSFAIRDCTSPVRVRVKNASDSRCRWRKTAARRSCITRWPDLVREQRLEDAERAGHDRDRDHPGRRSTTAPSCRVAEIASRTRLSRNAGTTPSAAETTIRQQDAAEPQLVRREERADPPQVRLAHGRVGGPLRRRLGRVEEHAHRLRVRRETCVGARPHRRAGTPPRRGSSHQALTPVCASSAVSPIASAIPAATRQSSPTMKSHQKRPNARTYLMPRLQTGRGPRRRRSAWTSSERDERHEADQHRQRQLVAGPVDAGALGAPRSSRSSSASGRPRT